MRPVAVYVWVVAALNALAWLGRVVPALASGGQAAFLRGTGLPTSAVYVQDLALWLPFIAVAGGVAVATSAVGFPGHRRCFGDVGPGKRRYRGGPVVRARSRPASPVAPAAFTPAFGVLALIGLVPAYYLFRGLRNVPHRRLAASRMPVAGHRCWQAWILAGILLLVGAAGVFGGVLLIRDGFGMPLSWLHQTPFTSWTLPGVALLAGVTVPQFTALALIVSGHRWALAASYLAGAGLVLWIAVQMLVLQQYFILQPAIAAAGAAEMLVALWQRAQAAPGGLPAVLLDDLGFRLQATAVILPCDPGHAGLAAPVGAFQHRTSRSARSTPRTSRNCPPPPR